MIYKVGYNIDIMRQPGSLVQPKPWLIVMVSMLGRASDWMAILIYQWVSAWCLFMRQDTSLLGKSGTIRVSN